MTPAGSHGSDRTWWILPYTGGLVVVLAVAAVVIGVRHPASGGQAPKTRPPAAASPAAARPEQMFPNALFGKLTAALQARNEAAFLNLASASARPAMKSWWVNLQAIGFTTGAVVPTARDDVMHVDSRGNGSTVALAGVHGPLDPVDDKGKPDVALTRYQIGIHFASPTATGQITSWKPLDDAPWDQGTRLYVRKDADVVVAGPPGDSALVDQTLPIAETAAAYDIGLVNNVHFEDLNQQQGFVVFVTGDAAVRNGWFATVKEPAGWPAQFLGGQTFQLPGPGSTPVDVTGAGRVSDGSTGGARVVVEPYSQDPNGGTPHSQTVTLVRDFMLAILASHDQNLVNGLRTSPVPSWSEEGLAVAVQTLFETSNDPTPARYDFGNLDAALASLPASYKTGATPTTTEQLYGPSLETSESWNDVAASVYEYIEQKYGMNQMLASAMLLWTRYTTPFGNVLAPGGDPGKGDYVFYTPSYVTAGWKAWLAARA